MRTLLRPQVPDTVDPQAVALEATLADLRRVSSELHDTNAALSQRISKLNKEKRE